MNIFLVLGRLCWIGFLVASLLPSIALADPAEDLALGEKAFNNEDLSGAMALMAKAAKANYAPAQVRFGEILDASEYDKEAADWYRKAAEQGDAAGEYHLGHMYTVGEGVEKNPEKALYWFRRAAEKNHLLAVKTLADAYQNGLLGLTIDLNMAKLLEDKAKILAAAARRADAAKLAEREAAKKAAAQETAVTAAEKTKQEQEK